VQVGTFVAVLAHALLVEEAGLGFCLLWRGSADRVFSWRGWCLVRMARRARRVYRRSSEDAWEVFESHSKSGEFWVSSVILDESDLVAVVLVRDELVDVADIVTAGEIDVPTLGVVDELPEQSSNFGVCILLQLSSIDEIKQLVGPGEISSKCSERTLFRTAELNPA
jgi:hypothetical protein